MYLFTYCKLSNARLTFTCFILSTKEGETTHNMRDIFRIIYFLQIIEYILIHYIHVYRYILKHDVNHISMTPRESYDFVKVMF